MLELVASKLGDLCEEVVFLGGCTTALFITDDAYPDVRYTQDVDCIIDVISRAEYSSLRGRLLKQGFKQSMDDEVICRWRYDDVILDIMPTDEKILGFGNRWYKPAIKYAFNQPLTAMLSIKLVTAPYFMATKFEAFKTRGRRDFASSHDFEDIITVLDGRNEIVLEIDQADTDLKEYLRTSFSEVFNNPDFHNALPGHFVHHGSLADDQITLLKEKLQQILK